MPTSAERGFYAQEVFRGPREAGSDGTKLGVATWGISHFGTETPTHQKPSRVYVYDLGGQTGQVSGTIA